MNTDAASVSTIDGHPGDRHTGQLSAAERELAALSYAISHDLRAPVRALLGFSDALSEHRHDLQPEAQHYLEHIHTAAERLQQMINGLLELSRISQRTVEPIEFPLPTIIQRAANKVQQRYPALHPQLHSTAELTLHCDPGLLTLALDALLDNAWKFTAEAPQPRIEITAQQTGRLVTLCIADNGVGMDLRHAAHFGAPFQHFHPQRGPRSLGLGLATAQRCAARLGGAFWAESTPNQGSKFYLQCVTGVSCDDDPGSGTT